MASVDDSGLVDFGEPDPGGHGQGARALGCDEGILEDPIAARGSLAEGAEPVGLPRPGQRRDGLSRLLEVVEVVDVLVEEGGCGCRTSPTGSGAALWLVVVGLLAIRRRRR